MAARAIQGITDELDLSLMPLVALNGFGLWAAFTTFGLAASVSFDRPGPAIGLSLAYLLIVNYFLEILGSLWTDAALIQDYSLFHHFNPGEILTGDLRSDRPRDRLRGGRRCRSSTRSRLPAPGPRRPRLSSRRSSA